MERVKKVHSTGGFGSQVFIIFNFYRSREIFLGIDCDLN